MIIWKEKHESYKIIALDQWVEYDWIFENFDQWMSIATWWHFENTVFQVL